MLSTILIIVQIQIVGVFACVVIWMSWGPWGLDSYWYWCCSWGSITINKSRFISHLWRVPAVWDWSTNASWWLDQTKSINVVAKMTHAGAQTIELIPFFTGKFDPGVWWFTTLNQQLCIL